MLVVIPDSDCNFICILINEFLMYIQHDCASFISSPPSKVNLHIVVQNGGGGGICQSNDDVDIIIHNGQCLGSQGSETARRPRAARVVTDPGRVV